MSNGREPAMSGGGANSNDVMLGGNHPIARIHRLFDGARHLELKFKFHPISDMVSAELAECLSDRRVLVFVNGLDVSVCRGIVVRPMSNWTLLTYSNYDYAVVAQLLQFTNDDQGNRHELATLGHIFDLPKQFLGMGLTFPSLPVINGWDIVQMPDAVMTWGWV